jgi:hypothetical protein
MADPVLGKKSNPQSLNRFSYGLSDPINNMDPTGLFNYKVEIPSDWPCAPFDALCSCDPMNSGDQDGFFDPVGPSVGCDQGGGGSGNGPRPCDVRLSAKNITEQPCSATKEYVADVQVEGTDVKRGQGGRVIFGKNSVTAVSEDESGVLTVGPVTQDVFDRTKFHQTVKVVFDGELTWTLKYKCNNGEPTNPDLFTSTTVKITCKSQ